MTKMHEAQESRNLHQQKMDSIRNGYRGALAAATLMLSAAPASPNAKKSFLHPV